MSCPDDTDLAGFLEEALPRERLAFLGAHVDGCARCQKRLDELTERYGATPELPDAPSGVIALEPDTQVFGRRPVESFAGLPDVPGFDVIGEIGRGGMGVVFKARHRRLNRLVALKMILAGSVADPSDVQRFLVEAEVLGRVQHPQIVQVLGADTYAGPNGVPIPYLVLELLDGGALSRALRDRNGEDRPRWPAPRAAAALVEGLARAVHAAHLRGVIHRDLKPGNILFDGPPDAPGAVPKVMDFGLAKFTAGAGDRADLTHSGQVVGTPQYMAPEQATGTREVGPPADVYALGAILYECLAGRPPFTGSDPVSVLMQVVNGYPPDVRALAPGVPRDLAAVTMKCLEKDPTRRYPTAEALAADLLRFLDDRPTRARPVGHAERAWFWVRRNPAVAGLAAALAAVLCAGFVAVAALWVRAENRARAADEAASRATGSEAQVRVAAERVAAALRDAREQRALLEFRRAVSSCEEGRLEAGLALFAQTVELAEQCGQADLARVARTNLAAWPREFPPAAEPLRHQHQPRHLAFHPHEPDLLVVAGRRGEMVLWNTHKRAPVRHYKSAPRTGIAAVGRIFDSAYWTVAISPNGRTVAAGSSDGTLTLWDLNRAEPLCGVPAVPNGDNLWSVAFTADDVLWTNDGRNGLLRWDVSDRARPRATPARPKHPGAAELQIMVASADRTRLYTGDRAAWVREWDAATGTERRAWRLKGWITDVAVGAGDTRLAATGPDGAWVIDLGTGAVALDLGLAGTYGNGIAFAPNAPFLVTADGDGNVRFWHRDTGQPVGIPMRIVGEITRPRFRPGSDVFGIPGGGGAYLSRVPDPPGDVLAAGTGVRVRGLAFDPAGRLAVADEFGAALYDPQTRKPVLAVPQLPEGPLAMCFDADPARLLFGTRVGFGHLDLRTGAADANLFGRALGRVNRVAAHPTAGTFLLAATLVARYGPDRTRPPRAAAPAPDAPAGVALGALAVAPDGREVLVAFADTVRFLDPNTLAVTREWRAAEVVVDARYLPGGDKVVVARRDNTAEVLSAATGARAVPRVLTHERAVTSVAVSPDGTLILTGSRDGTARFWDAATGLPLGAPLRAGAAVTHVAFNPKGDHAATGTDAGHVAVWDVPPPPVAAPAAELLTKYPPAAPNR